MPTHAKQICTNFALNGALTKKKNPEKLDGNGEENGEVFAIAKVKLRCSEVCASHK